MNNYQLPGNPVVPVQIVGNLVYDELGQEAIARLNEEFKGNYSIAYKTLPQIGQQVADSNVPRNLFLNHFTRKQCNDIHVSSPAEFLQYWQVIPERDTTYADSDSVSVFPNKGPNEDLRIEALRLIGKDSTKVPLVVSGLGVKRADNSPGFTLIESPHVPVSFQEAVYLEKDQKVRYDPKQWIVPCKENEDGVMIYTPSSQSGLRRLYRDGSDELYARDDDFLYSLERGRVPLVQDPKGRAENLAVLVNQLEQERDSQIALIKAKYNLARAKAMEIMLGQ